MIIQIKDVFFFKTLIKSMADNQYISFKTTDNKLIINSFSLNIYHIEIGNDIISIENYGETTFTVNSVLLLNSLEFFKSDLKLELTDILKLYSNTQKREIVLKIPLMNSLDTHLNIIENINMFFTISPANIIHFSNFKTTNLQLTNDKLHISQNIMDGMEEAFVEVEILEFSVENFNCDNKWYSQTKNIQKFVNQNIFIVNDSVCQISMNFHRYPDSLLIIQVPKLLLQN